MRWSLQGDPLQGRCARPRGVSPVPDEPSPDWAADGSPAGGRAAPMIQTGKLIRPRLPQLPGYRGTASASSRISQLAVRRPALHLPPRSPQPSCPATSTPGCARPRRATGLFLTRPGCQLPSHVFIQVADPAAIAIASAATNRNYCEEKWMGRQCTARFSLSTG